MSQEKPQLYIVKGDYGRLEDKVTDLKTEVLNIQGQMVPEWLRFVADTRLGNAVHSGFQTYRNHAMGSGDWD